MKKGVILLLVFIFLLASFSFIVSASVLTVGDFSPNLKQGDCFNIPLGCDNCTWANVTITYQNGTIIIPNGEMSTINGFHYNYSFCNTTNLDQYWVTFHYDDGVYPTTERDWFEVTKRGEFFNTGESILYFLITISSFGIFILCLFFTLRLSFNNGRNEEGLVFMITREKYIKMGLILLSYALFNWMMNLLVGISDYLNLTIYYGFFTMIFNLLTTNALIFFIIWAFAFILMLYKDSQIKRLLKRGIKS